MGYIRLQKDDKMLSNSIPVVLFDCDGVINNYDSFSNRKITYEKSYLLDKVKMIADLATEFNAQLVCVSSWAVSPDHECFQNLLNEFKIFGHDTIYIKPDDDRWDRPGQVNNIVKDYDIKQFVVLDDDWDEKSYNRYNMGNHLVKTSFYEEGLTEEHIKDARDKIKLIYEPKNR